MSRPPHLRGLAPALGILLLSASSTVAAQTAIVEDERKISATSGSFSGPLDPNDSFGHSMSFVHRNGDLVAVGAPFDDEGGTDQGAVWLLTLSSGLVQSEVKICEWGSSFAGDLDADDHFGYAVASFQAEHLLGDLDADGVSDLAVGAPWDDDGGSNKGAVWILLMNANGTVTSHKKISETSGEGFTGPLSGSFGSSLCAIGDLDNDAVPDLAVGEHNGVWILFMNADGSVKGSQQITEGVGGFTGPLGQFDRFGASIGAFDASGYDDLDDGVTDLVVGAPGTSPDGAAWVLFLDSAGLVVSEQLIAEGVGGLVGPLNVADNFGQSVSCLTDIDGDGLLEVAVGASHAEFGMDTDQGSVWLLSLASDGTVGAEWEIDDFADCTGINAPLQAGDAFGMSSSTANWFSGTSFELGIGAPFDDDGGFDQGAAWIVSVDMTQLPSTYLLYNATLTPNQDTLTSNAPVMGTIWTTIFTRSGGGSGRYQMRIWSDRLFGNGVAPQFGSVPWPIGTGGRRLCGGVYYASIPAGQSVSGSPVAPTLPYGPGSNAMSISIPCDTNFLGLHFTAQARSGTGVAGTGTPRLSSAIEGTIGTY